MIVRVCLDLFLPLPFCLRPLTIHYLSIIYYKMQSNHMFTTRYFAKQSFGFKFSTISFITTLATVLILAGFVQPNVACYYGGQCYNNRVKCARPDGTLFCCVHYQGCGEENHCTGYQQKHRVSCLSIQLAIVICSLLSIIFLCAMIIMWCNFWRRTRNPDFNPQADRSDHRIAPPQPFQLISYAEAPR